MDDLLPLFYLSGIQAGLSYQNVTRSRQIASRLVLEDGSLQRAEGKKILASLEKSIFDPFVHHHYTQFLEKWLSDDLFFKALQTLSLPVCHASAEKLIYDSLALPFSTPLTHAHLRKAVISAFLTPLRQTVGSCFATAPAILIHEEQPFLFLTDLKELLFTGKLKRVLHGEEYSVPLSGVWGRGDLRKRVDEKIILSPGMLAALEAAKLINSSLPLNEKLEKQKELLFPFLKKQKRDMNLEELLDKVVPPSLQNGAKTAFKAVVDHALLKAWEFTIASLAEAKSDFSKWNLFVSLGLNPEEKGGIGEILYSEVEEALKEANEKIENFQNELTHAYDATRLSETLIKQAESEREARRLQADYQGKAYHFHICLELRDKWILVGKKLSSLFSFISERYYALFPLYFQEIYDPEIAEFMSKEEYADSPAGFRLVFKQGRSNASLWKPIYNAEEFIQALIDFFTLVEHEIKHGLSTEEEQGCFSQASLRLIHHIRSPDFLQSAYERNAPRHAKPWSYISGGTLPTLLQLYFSKETPLTEERRDVESELDLLTFIIDTLKELPPKISNAFLQNPQASLLMHSPTHAFLLKPGLPFFEKAWEDRGLTYTWIRDEFLVPMQQFFNITLSRHELTFLRERFKLPLKIKGEASLKELYEHLEPLKLDSFFYESFPLIPQERCQAVLHELLASFNLHPELAPSSESYVTAFEIRQIAHYFLLQQGLLSAKTKEEVLEKARQMGIAPRPCLFADTNWVNSYFAFIVHPATQKLELWRTDPLGERGEPMREWTPWLNKSKKSTWVIFTNTQQYVGVLKDSFLKWKKV